MADEVIIDVEEERTEDEEVMLTTLDNPFNPFSQFDEWFVFDSTHGYNTCGYLDRITLSSDELSINEQRSLLRKAMNEMMKLNLFGNLVIVTKENFNLIMKKADIS